MHNETKVVLRSTPAEPEALSEGTDACQLGLEAIPRDTNSGLEIDVDELPLGDAVQRRPNETIESQAPSMDIRLIEPVGCPDPSIDPTGGDAGAWGVRAVGASDSRYTGKGITVAILDSGIDADHPAFKSVKLIQKDFTCPGQPDHCPDELGHGTHCAGILFGRPVRGNRIGIAPRVKRAVIGKIFGAGYGGTSAQVCDAIDWAADQDAHIISMSMAFDVLGYVKRLRKDLKLPVDIAIAKALSAYRDNLFLIDRVVALLDHQPRIRPLIIAAAGNDSRRHLRSDFEVDARMPAAREGVVSVGALGRNKDGALRVKRFSNVGVDVVAPGSAIYSAKPGEGLCYKAGTSMAAAHAAGVAALWAEKLLRETGHVAPNVLRARLIGQATKARLAPGFNPRAVGAGLVQAPPLSSVPDRTSH